jgi:gluconate 5-dehydrogenase
VDLKHLPSTRTLPLFDLTNRVAWVTGATGRLGQEIAAMLADMGAHVVITSRTAATLTVLESALSQKTCAGRILPIVANTNQSAEIDHVMNQVDESFGRLDILVNTVSGNARAPVETLTETAWNQALHDILTGMFLCCQAAGKRMKAQQSGNIINIASIYGVVAADQRIYGDSGLNSSLVYGSGKGAVIQLTRYLASYWGRDGIRVNAITPGGVEDTSNDHPVFREQYTARTPMQRMMRREEIRGPLAFLASDASSYVTGHNLVVDGGFTIV